MSSLAAEVFHQKADSTARVATLHWEFLLSSSLGKSQKLLRFALHRI